MCILLLIDFLGLLLDLLYYARVTHPSASDELYFQLCKQLNNHNSEDEDENGSSSSSVIAGWLTFTVYIHCIAPLSESAAPYIRNFLLSQLKLYETEKGGNPNAIIISKLILYCVITFDSAKNKKVSNTTSTLNKDTPYSLPSYQMNADVIEYIFLRREVELEVALMNGSVYNLTFAYGECFSVFAIILKLFERLYGMYNIMHTIIHECITS